MDTTSEQQYAAASGKNGAMPEPLGSKGGSNRGGTRGASDEVVDQGQTPEAQAGFTFEGDSSGRNDVGNAPEDRGHTDSTLNAPKRNSF